MIDFDFSILQCPVTKEDLIYIQGDTVNDILKRFNSPNNGESNLTEGFINKSRSYFYPVSDGIIILLPVYSLFIGEGHDIRVLMGYDKERVFNYYNQIGYNNKNGLHVYEDSGKWVDNREVSNFYIRNSFGRAKKFLGKGKYILDIASGPIGINEYIKLSDEFEIRICIDISVKALEQAKLNYGRKGIYICADITQIPLKNDICDSVLCQHTLYHLPKNDQKIAVNELYRVAKNHSFIVIVYSLFYHSWFMNITLMPVQVYRVLRHFAGKILVRSKTGKTRLYFYSHSLQWFKTNFQFSNKIKFYCWRSTNKYFLNIFIHRFLGGDSLLQWLMKSEEKHSEFWGNVGEYPLIVIHKTEL